MAKRQLAGSVRDKSHPLYALMCNDLMICNEKLFSYTMPGSTAKLENVSVITVGLCDTNCKVQVKLELDFISYYTRLPRDYVKELPAG